MVRKLKLSILSPLCAVNFGESPFHDICDLRAKNDRFWHGTLGSTSTFYAPLG